MLYHSRSKKLGVFGAINAFNLFLLVLISLFFYSCDKNDTAVAPAIMSKLIYSSANGVSIALLPEQNEWQLGWHVDDLELRDDIIKFTKNVTQAHGYKLQKEYGWEGLEIETSSGVAIEKQYNSIWSNSGLSQKIEQNCYYRVSGNENGDGGINCVFRLRLNR